MSDSKIRLLDGLLASDSAEAGLPGRTVTDFICARGHLQPVDERTAGM